MLGSASLHHQVKQARIVIKVAGIILRAVIYRSVFRPLIGTAAGCDLIDQTT